jgi:hypothetical protein
MSKLTAYRLTKIFLTIWFITWFILDNQIGYLLTAPYIIAMGLLPSHINAKENN